MSADPSSEPSSLPASSRLPEDAARLLDFEREWWRYAGHKEASIREHFGIAPTTYYTQLNRILDDPDALAYDPMLVKRLRRLRARREDAGKASRTARR